MHGIRLLFKRGEERLLQLRLERSEVILGSAASNDVVVPDPQLPDVAARLVDRGDGSFELSDLTGGLLSLDVDRPGGEARLLQKGDAFRLGGFVLELQGEPGYRPGHGTDVLDRSGPKRPGGTLETPDGHLHPVDSWGSFTIGSEVDNDLRLQDPFVSGYHCRLSRSDHRWRILDLGSTNGTSVNGVRVREAELPERAVIGVGQVELRFDTEALETEGGHPSHGMVARSPGMQEVFRLVRRFADSSEPVLVMGASGTGKEGVARALHDGSSRAGGPYLTLNCGALASNLIESELFGYARGAFTGAHRDKKGAFEAASDGTLFLDEVGELPLDLQPSLLRVLETKKIRRLGETHERSVDTRIVAATHQNLSRLVEAGRFREDLFHRLFVLSISIPPLKDRPEDVEALTERFLALESTQPRRLSPQAKTALRGHVWPGNVRELRNVLVRAVLTTDDLEIRAEDLQFSSEAFVADAPASRRMDVEEKASMEAALAENGGNGAAAARQLGMSKSTFYDKIRRLGIRK